MGAGWALWRYQKPRDIHSRFAMLTSSLYHRILINITTCGGMEEENSFSSPVEWWRSCTGIHLRFFPCPKATNSCCKQISWGAGRTLITRTSVSLALTTRNLLPSSPFIPDIEQDAPDSFFMTTRRQAINADCMVASNIIFSGDNDCVGCRYLCYLLTQEVEQLSFVVTVSQEVLPVSGDFALACNPASDSMSSLCPCLCSAWPSNDCVSHRFCIRDFDIAFKNGSKLGFLTGLELLTFTKGSRKLLILMTKELPQVTFSALTWDEPLREQLAVFLQHL